jgi:hypothetical protein
LNNLSSELLLKLRVHPLSFEKYNTHTFGAAVAAGVVYVLNVYVCVKNNIQSGHTQRVG